MRVANALTGLVFLVLSFAYYQAAGNLPTQSTYGDSGPAELPRLIALGTGIVALCLMGHAVFLKAMYAAAESIGAIPRRGMLFLLWSLLAAFALPVAHTIPTLAAYVFGGVLLQTGRTGLPLAALSAVLIPALIFCLFQLLLGVPLP